MGILLSLTVMAWAAGGGIAGAWIFWLDRRRGEFGVPIKVATFFAWPLLLPILLHQREDLSGWEAARNAAVWIMVLSPGLALDVSFRVLSALAPRQTAPVVVDVPRPFGLPLVIEHASASPKFVEAAPRTDTYPRENDKREAVRHWNAGIIYYQKGDYEKSRDEWRLCDRLDPGNSDCRTGLARIDQSYGPAP